MSDSPGKLPGDVREADEALGLDALADVRAKIAAHLDDTQGAWQTLPAWRRLWPVALAVLGAVVWLAYNFAHGAPEPSAVLGAVASVLAFVAVARAPRAPAAAETLGLAALALVVGSIGLEVLDAVLGPAVTGGTTIGCARAIGLGALAPLVLLGTYLRLAKMPARRLHVAAVVAAAFVASGAAVWSECPGTLFEHVMMGHAVIPLVLALALGFALAPLLRGPKL